MEASALPPSSDAPPNETLYVNNLNEKTKKEDLRRGLYALFSQYGTVLDVIAKKTLKLRGQAWIVFRDIGSATTALRQLQGFVFFDKPLRVQYAKEKSDLIAKLQDSFVPREKRPRPPLPKKGPKPVKKPKSEAAEGADGASAVPQPKANPPNHKLFVQNLPELANELMLKTLFQQFPGLKEVRMVPGKKGISFVDFGTEEEAGTAIEGLQGFLITPNNPLVISYAKK